MLFLKTLIGNLLTNRLLFKMKNKFELAFIEKLIFSNYKIRSKAIQINGEIDDNFKLISRNDTYFFKIYAVNTEKEFVKFQVDILSSLKKNKKTSNNKPAVNGSLFGSFTDKNNNLRFYRMNSWIEGRLWSKVNPINKSLRFELGEVSAKISKELKIIKKSYERKNFHWDLQNFLWIENYVNEFKDPQINRVKKLIKSFKKEEGKYKSGKNSPHNDLFSIFGSEICCDHTNDNGIICSHHYVYQYNLNKYYSFFYHFIYF